MNIDTYFGFFAKSVFTAVGTSLTEFSGQAVNLSGLHISTTNTLRLRFSNVDTVLVPELAAQVEVNFVLALSDRDMATVVDLAADRLPPHKMLEQVVSTAAEPFNFVTKRRNRLTGLQVSRNVTGFAAHHLGGAVAYTMATGTFSLPRGGSFALHLLVTPQGRDTIEDRVTNKAAQRALFSINEGAYLCRPQWEPPPPPPGLERGAGLSEASLNGWLQTHLGCNDGLMANRLFGRPVGLSCHSTTVEVFQQAAVAEGPPTVVRLILNNNTALELFVVLPTGAASNLMRLSRSGNERFLGDMFRALYADSAKLWERFSGTEVRWRLQAVRRIPSDAVDAVTSRLEGGGLVVRQVAALDDGQLAWLLAIPPHTWQWLMRLADRGMVRPADGLPNREAVFNATNWGRGEVPWRVLLNVLQERDLQQLIRLLQQSGLTEAHFAAVAESVDKALRLRWVEAMPVMLRERTERYRLAESAGRSKRLALTRTLMALNRAHKLPEGKLVDWLTLYTEFFWSYAQHAVDEMLPLRHLVYGMDRASLSRLLRDTPSRTLTEMLSAAEFPAVDQFRRAASPRFAVRMLEDVAETRAGTSAYAAQKGLLDFYRLCYTGMTQGRYMIRANPAGRLRELIRLLDEQD